MNRKGWAGLIAIVIIAMAVAGTIFITLRDDGEPGGGPLQDTFHGETGWCGPGEPGDRFSFGEDFSNPSSVPLVIKDITFESLEGMSLVGIVRIPDATGSQSVGAMPEWPAENLSDKTWASVQQIPNLTLQPDEPAHVVFGLELVESRGRASGIVIEYELDGRPYKAVKTDFFTMKANCHSKER